MNEGTQARRARQTDGARGATRFRITIAGETRTVETDGTLTAADLLEVANLESAKVVRFHDNRDGTGFLELDRPNGRQVVLFSVVRLEEERIDFTEATEARGR